MGGTRYEALPKSYRSKDTVVATKQEDGSYLVDVGGGADQVKFSQEDFEKRYEEVVVTPTAVVDAGEIPLGMGADVTSPQLQS